MRSKRKTGLLSFGIVIALLALLRIAAPHIVLYAANDQLNKIDGITGSIADIDISLVKGAYYIRELELYATESFQPQPLLFVNDIKLSVLWSALLKGTIVAEITINNPVVFYRDVEEEVENLPDSVKNEQTYIDLAKSLSPFSIDRLVINNATAILQMSSEQLQGITVINEINASVSNITNSKNTEGELISAFRVNGLMMNQAKFDVKGSFNPFAEQPSFDVNATTEKLMLKEIDDLVRFYTPFDIEEGEVDVAMELVSLKGNVSGYVKPSIKNLSIFEWKEDAKKDGDNPLNMLFEGFSDAMALLLESDQKDNIAARLPIEGTLNNTEVSALEALLSILRNAFVKAIDTNLENSVSVDALKEPSTLDNNKVQ